MKPILGQEEIVEACSLPQAIVFLFVDWSVQARNSGRTAQELVLSLAQHGVASSPPFFCADLSEQDGRTWTVTREWLSAAELPADELTFGGYGALIWLKYGKVIAYVGDAGKIGPEKLLLVTKQAFDYSWL